MNTGWGCEEWFAILGFVESGGALLLAALSALTAVFAWIVKLLTQWLHAVYTTMIARLEVMKALTSEISVNVANECTWDDKAKNEIISRMQAYKKTPYDFLPYAPVYEDNPIYDEIRKRITVLPTAAIDSVVLYYNESNGLTAQIKDIRSDAFLKLDKKRRIEAVKGIYEDAKFCVSTGRNTLGTLAKLIDRDQSNMALAKIAMACGLALTVAAAAKPAAMLPSIVKAAVELASSCKPSVKTADTTAARLVL